MDYQAERLGLIVDLAEQSMDIVQRFSNDPIDAESIQTGTGPIKNLKQVSADIKFDGQAAIDVAVTELIDTLKTETSVSALIEGLTDTAALAEKSAARAEVASDSANATGKIYDSTAIGLLPANTAPGQYFSVPSPESREYLILYKNNGGVAVEIKRYLSADVLPVKLSRRTELRATDNSPFKKTFFLANEKKLLHAAVGDVGERFEAVENITKRTSGRSGRTAAEFMDSFGKVFARITEKRIRHPEIYEIKASIESAKRNRFRRPLSEAGMLKLAALAEMIHVIIYGQSLSLGENTQVGLSTVPADNALMFHGGVVSNNGKIDAENYQAIRPLASTTTRETPAPGMAAMVAQLLRDEDGIELPILNQMLLMNCPGEGGQRMQDLDKGSTGYTRLMTGIHYGNLRATELNKGYLNQVFYMLQGESSYDIGGGEDPELYQTLFYQLLADLKADTLSATGVSRDPLVIWYQTSSHNRAGKTPGIALKQIEMVEANENYVFSTPVYPLPYSNDLIHVNNVGAMMLGAYGGLAMKRALWDGVKTHPLLFGAPVRVGNNSVLLPRKYSGTPLVLDAEALNPGNFGFSGATAALVDNPVLEVTLAGPDAVKVRFQNPVSAGDKVRYAWIGTADYGCGCLRDSQGDEIVFRHAGVVWPMHNWAPIQELTL